ncbi:MAG: HAD family hydrolase [Sphingomonadaceae bacterium]|nr:HAD family hydrolase [Sphingomonadaceae bacterium]
MNRPLVICDCDDVLLHMVSHFGDWLGEAHDLDFKLEGHNFIDAVRPKGGGDPLKGEEVWPLLQGFFDTEMGRQTPVPGASESLVALSEHAEIVILTNLVDEFRDARAQQLSRFGIDYPVHTNQGPKGTKAQSLLAEYAPTVAVFVDDLSNHHQSVAETAPEIWRLHMIAEPTIASNIPPAEHAHVRIDDWHEARRWIIDRITEGEKA